MTANQPFLSRKTIFGLRNYFLIIMAVCFILPVITRGARQAVESNNNDIKDWLPENYEESTVLSWFQQHFLGEQFALISWEGATLGDTHKLRLLSEKLVPSDPEAPRTERQQLFKTLTSGPGALEMLTRPPLNLSYEEAIERLEGSLIGPRPEGGSDDDRVTCIVVTLSETAKQDNKHKALAIDAIRAAAAESGIARVRLGGPPVDNVAIDIEGKKTLFNLAVLSGIVGLSLSYLCFRSVKLTFMVFSVGVLAAGLALALVYYFGVLEVVGFGYDRPRLGAVDAILMSMPPVVYVLGLSGAIHIVNYYRDARREHGIEGAAERAIGHGWIPCTIAALTTSVGLASLYISDITPIKKFGLFSALGVITTLSLLFTLLPACLYRFAPADEPGSGNSPQRRRPVFDFCMTHVASRILRYNKVVVAGSLVVMVVFAMGLQKIETRIQLLKLFDENAEIIHDYTWLEANLGKLVPMEVVVQVDATRQRAGTEDAEQGSDVYRMTLLERMRLVQRVQHRIETLPEVGRAMSAATFGPSLDADKSTLERTIGASREFVVNERLEQGRHLMLAEDYLREEAVEPPAGQAKPAGPRELWRISARLGALDDDLDYGIFVDQLKAVVEPVLLTYGQRDHVVRQLHAQDKRLRLSRVCLVHQTPEAEGEAREQPGQLLGKLLHEAGARVTALNLARLTDEQLSEPKVEQIRRVLTQMDAVVVVADGARDYRALMGDVPLLIDLTQTEPAAELHAGAAWGEDVLARPAPVPEFLLHPNGIDAVYTGIVPLVYKTQRQLLISLQESIALACLLIAVVMVMVLRSVSAGLLSMFPNVFPIVLVFGAMGWLGIKVDIGIMMTASVALGVAVDDTVHFLTWFRDGIRSGMDRRGATMLAYQRCASAMLQTTLIAGVGLSVFAVSTFTPTQQFGVLMVTLLSAALLGDLVFLPALLVSPIGYFFGGKPVAAQPASPAEPPSTEGNSTPPPHGRLRQDAPHHSVRY